MIRAGSGDVRAALALVSAQEFVSFLAGAIRDGNRDMVRLEAWPGDPAEWLAKFLVDRLVRLGMAAARVESSGAPQGEGV